MKYESKCEKKCGASKSGEENLEGAQCALEKAFASSSEVKYYVCTDADTSVCPGEWNTYLYQIVSSSDML